MTEQPAGPTVAVHVEAPKPARGAVWGTVWWIFSVSMHATLVGCIVYFTPLRHWFFDRPSPEDALKSMQGIRLGGMVGSLLDVHTTRIKEKMKEQQAVLAKMTELRDKGWTRYLGDLKFYGGAAAKTALPAKAEEALGAAGPGAGLSLEGKSVHELYSTAQDVEKTTCQTYRQIRAIELARLQNLPLKEALENTNVAVPTHEAMDFAACEPEFVAGIVSAADGKLEQLKQELTKVRCEIETMVSTGYRMLDYAQGLIPDDVGTSVAGPSPGGPSGSQTEGQSGHGGRGRRVGSGEQGYTGQDPGAFSHDWGTGAGPVTHKSQTYSREAGLNLGRALPVAASKLMEGGEGAEWAYIDTWYIIGPFANPNRKGIDQKFPPEVQGCNGVDLDAVYMGQPDRAGKPRHVRWLWRQSQDVCVIPHYPEDETVYYAFTEVYSEKDQARWCIFGSDDWGRCWINGEVVYTSGKTPHPWIPDRGLKKVAFHKGANQVLFKFENAWGRTGFSVCINLTEQ